MAISRFIEDIINQRTAFENYCDKILSPDTWGEILEYFYDHFMRETKSIEMRDHRTQLLNNYRLSKLTSCYQFFLSSFYLIRNGLDSPAYAALRSCLEQYLAWYLLGRDIDLLKRSWIFSMPKKKLNVLCRHENGIQESIAFMVTEGNIDLLEDALDWHSKHIWIKEHYKITEVVENYKPQELKSKIDSFWNSYAITSLYSILSTHVHLSKKTLQNNTSLFGDDLTKPDRIKFNITGKEIEPIKLISFYFIWLRIGICILDNATKKSVDNDGDRVLAEYLDEQYAIPDKIQCYLKLSRIIDAMWSWNDKMDPYQINMLIINSGDIGKITLEDPDDQNMKLIQEIPLCSRDPLIHMWRNEGKIPIPRLSLAMKRKIGESKTNKVGQKKKESLVKEWLDSFGVSLADR